MTQATTLDARFQQLQVILAKDRATQQRRAVKVRESAFGDNSGHDGHDERGKYGAGNQPWLAIVYSTMR